MSAWRAGSEPRASRWGEVCPTRGRKSVPRRPASDDPAEAAARTTAERERRVWDRARDEGVLPARFAGPPIAQDCRRLREGRDDRAGLGSRDSECPPQAVVAKVGALVEDQESIGASYEIHDSGPWPSK